jgi:redox-regulated HSP33 family molecular chaperone
MFKFQAKFLLKPTTTVMPDATKTVTANHLQSRLLKERQLRAKNESQQCARCRCWR